MKFTYEQLNKEIVTLGGIKINIPVKQEEDFSTETENETQQKPVMRYMTYKDAIIDALMANYQDDEKHRKGIAKNNRFLIAERLTNAAEGSEVTLTSEEISLTKELVGVLWSPLIVGPTWRFLEGELK